MKKTVILTILLTMLMTCVVNLFDITGFETEAATITTAEVKLNMDKITRVFGSNRYATSLAISETYRNVASRDKLDTVILANGANFADALAGSALADAFSSPILIINDNNASKIRDYIYENVISGGRIYILGGTAAVSEKSEKMFGDYNVIRLAGDTRFETNLKILEEAHVPHDVLLVATGNNFADSLSASAVGLPILLVGDKLKDDQLAMLEEEPFEKIYILGGEKAVSSEIEAELGNYGGSVKRIAGNNRFETSVKIADKFFENPEMAVLAYSGDFPDGLCGGPLAGINGAPVLLCKSDYYPEAKAYLKENGIKKGLVLGGAARLTDACVRDIFGVEDSYVLDNVRKSFFYTDEEIRTIEDNLPDDLRPYYGMMKEFRELPLLLVESGFKSELLGRYVLAMRNRGKSASEAIEMVNANKDYIPFENLNLTEYYNDYENCPDPSSYTALVSKKSYIGTYAPTDLVTIPSNYRGNYQPLRRRAFQAFKEMSDAAVAAGYNRIICYSNYRPYAEQAAIYNDNVRMYGVRATDNFSARPGFSEHQTGLTSDIAESGSSYHYFNSYKGYQWVMDNAHKYGLNLRYPKGKEYITGYDYEWWHFRYVGVEPATIMYKFKWTFDEYKLIFD